MTLQRQTHETISARYEAYWAQDAPPPVGDPLAPVRLRLLRDRLAGIGAHTALEIGCGLGDVTAALSGDGFLATGMDLAVEAVRAASKRHPDCTFRQHPVERLPWPVEAASQDVAVSFEVIEHLMEPRALLMGAHEVLRTGGHLALTTPYHGTAKNIVMALRGFDSHFDVEGEHIRFFSDRALRRLLGESGFDVIELTHFGRFAPLWAGVFVWAVKR
jgi:2-polyprenyl-6-hydroxyphenyl methylase/3-demethylubiquinone-9 3-methyltransferase